MKQRLAQLRAWFSRNFTWKGLLALLVWIAKDLPDWLGRRNFWGTNLPILGHFLVQWEALIVPLVAAVLIWLDHRAVIKKHHANSQTVNATEATRGNNNKTRTEISLPAPLSNRITQFCRQLSGYIESYGPRPDEDKLWNETHHDKQLFVDTYNQTIQKYDDKVAAGYWRYYQEGANKLRNELVFEFERDKELDDALGELDTESKGKHLALMKKVVERLRYKASQLPG